MHLHPEDVALELLVGHDALHAVDLDLGLEDAPPP